MIYDSTIDDFVCSQCGDIACSEPDKCVKPEPLKLGKIMKEIPMDRDSFDTPEHIREANSYKER